MNMSHGAHEYMDVHEVLSDAINKIDQLELYQPYCQDPKLDQLISNQITFMTKEYNEMVQALQGTAPNQAGAHYQTMNPGVHYGMKPTPPKQPNTSSQQLTDANISSGILGCHKSSASLRMMSSMECTNTRMRHLLVQGAVNSSEMAYEVFGYMNQHNYYQVPELPAHLAQTFQTAYQPLSPQI